MSRNFPGSRSTPVQQFERFTRAWKTRGARATLLRLLEEAADVLHRVRFGRSHYEQWFYDQLESSLALTAPAQAADGPLISIIMPVCDPDPAYLGRAIDSVREQRYENWELCIADDSSRLAAVASILSRGADSDHRIRVRRLEERQGISGASNAALGIARGNYVALLDHDDELTPDALLHVARAAEGDGFDILYSDEDKISPRGTLRDPTFKPDRSPDLLAACMYFGHLTVYKRTFIDDLGGFDADFDGSQDHHLALRADARATRVIHLPRVLYHWRMAPGSAANPNGEAKPWAYEAGRRAVQNHVQRTSPGGRVEPGAWRGSHRVIRPLADGSTVSVVADPATAHRLGPMASGSVEILGPISPREAGSIPAEAWNASARGASGDVLVFLDRALPATPGWWTELASQALRPEIGMVGARIASAAGRLLHLGVVLGGPETLRTRTGGLFRDDPGPLGIAQIVREVGAVTGGCLAIRRSLFEEMEGFDSGYQRGLYDVDLCLRIRERGLRILYDPHVLCIHAQNNLPSSDAHDRQRIAQRHPAWLGDDPYSNPAFEPEGPVFRPAYRNPRQIR